VSKPGCVNVNVTLAGPAFAQFNVSDANGALSGAFVRVWDDDSGVGQGNFTNSTGNTTVGPLPPGTYSYEVFLPGCIPVLRFDNLTLTDGNTTYVNVTLVQTNPWWVRGNFTGANVSGISVLLIRNNTASQAAGFANVTWTNFTTTNTTGYFAFGIPGSATQQIVPPGIYESRFLNSTGSQVGNSTVNVTAYS
jgi:hypothetical protein